MLRYINYYIHCFSEPILQLVLAIYAMLVMLNRKYYPSSKTISYQKGKTSNYDKLLKNKTNN